MKSPEPRDPEGELLPPIAGQVIVPSKDALLFGRYRVIRELGRGGMGVVLLARDEELDVDIAIKLVPDLLMQDQVALDELKHEVLRGMALTHPGIVRTHGFVRDSTMAAIAMEYVDGGNFTDLKLAHIGRCFDCGDLLPWIEQLCPVLDYAHFEIKIAHRDLKPQNLMLTRSGRIKVADFGISSTLNDTVSRVSMRNASSGTPAYMSPQQIMGDRPSHLDDVYALGATLYELLTGKPPFYKGHILAQVLDCPPALMINRREEIGITGKSGIPTAWEETIAACLAKEPGRRPQSAGEVLGRLHESSTVHLPSRPSAGALSGTAPKARPRSHSGGKWITAIVLVALAAVGFAVVQYRQVSSRSVAAEPFVMPTASITPAAVGEPEPPRITTPDELPSGRVGDGYKSELTATGGAPPYEWSAPQPLSAGLALAGAGLISGIPAVAGENGFELKITDRDGLSDSRQVRLVILEKLPPVPEPTPPPEPSVTPAPVPVVPVIPMIAADREHPYENSLGMKFVPAGTEDVLCSVWLTRVVDFRAFVTATSHDAKKGVSSVQIGGKAGFFPLNIGDCWENPGFAQTDNHPVCGVSWNDAVAFCDWLTKRELGKGILPEGFKYRLPKDAEWKNAVSVGGNPANPDKPNRYPWGNAWPPPGGYNFAGPEMRDGGVTPRDWPIIEIRDDFPRTSPVDRSKANRFGIRDPYGNLWQFCEEATDPANAFRLMRGGSWGTFDKEDLDLAKPKGRPADRRVIDAGFRCVIARSD